MYCNYHMKPLFLTILISLIILIIPLQTYAYNYHQPYYNTYYYYPTYYHYNPATNGYDDYYAHLPSTTPTQQYPQTHCSQITIETPQTYIKAGDTGKLMFTVQNWSDQTFYIGNVTVYSQNPDLIVRTPQYTSTIPAHGQITIETYVKAFSNADNKTRSGTIRISGAYVNGKACSAIQIGEKHFLVTTQNGLKNVTTKKYNNYAYSQAYLTTKDGKPIEQITKTETNSYLPSTWRNK